MLVNIKTLSVSLTAGLITYLSTYSTEVHAHGWSEFPNARQNICSEQGGIWSGNPPNEACHAAKSISGTYPFVQRNEYSKNVIDYNNMDAIKAAVPDGSLCYANDPQKKGMGTPHTKWTRTELSTGTFEYVFNATAPHNPSFWQFYLTHENADLSKGLSWSDLELINSVGNVPVQNGKYKIDLTIPENRKGDAILFVRWQRVDAAGEGFYNCSDITIVNGNDQTPPDSSKQNLYKGAQFLPSNLPTISLGDTAKYEILNKHGQLAREFELVISESNKNDWDRLLASKVNGWHAEFKDGAVFIGDWHEEMAHYMYFQNAPKKNFFNSKDSRATGRFSIVKGSVDNEALVAQIYELEDSDNIIVQGQKVFVSFNEPVTVSQTQGATVEIEKNDTTNIIINTGNVDQNTSLTFLATGLDSNRSKTFTFEIISDEKPPVEPIEPVDPEPIEPDVPSEGDWDPSLIYTGGDTVMYLNQQWEAQWWTKGGENPATTYDKNKWGVWRPLN